MTTQLIVPPIEIKAPLAAGFDEILTPEALRFLYELHRKFEPRRLKLLQDRALRQKGISAGILPGFPPETKHIREAEWKIAPVPPDIRDRRVEITGPTERKMMINALNSGARVFMADLEDANSPLWHNVIQGQLNLRDANRRTLLYTNPDGKAYQLNNDTAVLFVRPRGWHLNEKHLECGGETLSASLTDFGLYFFHNARQRLQNNSGTYLYLPKLENRYEARLWNDVFVFAQEYLGIPQGTIKATVLIETLLATFEAEEILYELREHSAGLNCGRWDYIFSYIKKLHAAGPYILPDRAQVGMTSPFMRAYSLHVIRACHKRGAHAIGGMSAFIPVKNDEEANRQAFEKVREDKTREVTDGHDGTWVAHPGLVATAMDVFDRYMPGPNQIMAALPGNETSAADLIAPPPGSITENGLRTNIQVGILYIESWLRGNGAAAIHNLMEDAATAEISRAQVWQWLHYACKLDDGRTLTNALYESILQEELLQIERYVGSEAYRNGRFAEARELFSQLVLQKEFAEFLTLEAYDRL